MPPLKAMDRSFKQKISKEISALNDTLVRTDIIDIYRAFHPRTPDYTFSVVHKDILKHRTYVQAQD